MKRASSIRLVELPHVEVESDSDQSDPFASDDDLPEELDSDSRPVYLYPCPASNT